MKTGVHRFAVVVACATFILIIAGALVTSHDAGLATSDWPLSNGQVFPKMVGNLFWEHGHRLVATTVGLLTILLTIYLFRSESRFLVRRLGLLALAGVVAQGLLGGLTVKLMLPLVVSAAHATLAQLFFCTTVSLAVCTIFLQLILGAVLRHSATWDRPLPTQLVLAHIGGALAVTLLLGSAALLILRRYKNENFLTRPATLAISLLLVQVVLGFAAYLTRVTSPNDPQPLKPMVGITVAHVACGALVFATSIVLTLRTFRFLQAPVALFNLSPSPQGS